MRREPLPTSPLAGSGRDRPDRWIKRLTRTPTSRLRIYGLPYAGGGADVFRSWATELPRELGLHAFLLPGRQERIREPSYTSLPALVTDLADALGSELDPALPFVLFGHSMGGLLAYELTRELRRRGRPVPVRIFVSGCRAPQVEDPDPPIHGLPDPALRSALGARNVGFGEIAEHEDLMRLILPVLRADLELCETYVYRPEPPLDIPISVSGGTQDRQVSRGELEAWREQTVAGFALRMHPGDHFFLVRSRTALLEALVHDCREHLRAPA